VRSRLRGAWDAPVLRVCAFSCEQVDSGLTMQAVLPRSLFRRPLICDPLLPTPRLAAGTPYGKSAALKKLGPRPSLTL